MPSGSLPVNYGYATPEWVVVMGWLVAMPARFEAECAAWVAVQPDLAEWRPKRPQKKARFLGYSLKALEGVSLNDGR